MTLRQAAMSDASNIAALTRQLGYEASEHEIRDRLAVLLRQPSQFIAVAESGGGIVGWVAAEERVLLEAGTRVEIVGLVVAVEHRRAGVGRALLEAAEGWQAKRGVSTIFVRSNVARTESHPFYEGLGYRRLKTQHAYIKQADADRS